MNVKLNGHVVGDDEQWLFDYFGIEAFSPGKVRQAIEDTPEGEDLVLEINSGGGSVFSGFEMYSVLRGAKCRTVAQVQSLAASAASTVISGCSEVWLSPVAQVMIHLPTSCAEGNQRDMRHEARVLESITQSILNGYESRCGGKTTREKLDTLIRAETWLSADEAVELGLADGILWQDDGAATLPRNIVNAVGGGMRALAGAAAPVSVQGLLERYEQLVRDGAPPAEGHPVAGASGAGPKSTGDDWRRGARLAIEHNRYL